METYDVIVVGELNADLILSGDVTPTFGQVEKLIDDATLTLGSSSAIFACGAARLGLRVGLISKVGDDDLGRMVMRQLHERGVDTSGVIVNPAIKTGLTVILSRGVDRAMLTYAGSIGALRYNEIDMQHVARARHLHLGSYFLLDALRPDVPRLFAAARAAGLSVSMDTNYDPAEAWDGGLAEAMRHVDVLLPNETEACAIAKSSSSDEAIKILAGRVPVLAVKLGSRGALAHQNGEHATAAVFPTAVVDTTGAGDSFDAGFVYGYINHWPLERALRLACVCGTLSTRAAGGTAAQATLEEAIALL